MFPRYERYYEAEVLTNASTNKYELPKIGVLTAIKLDFRQSNAATIDGANRARIVDRLTEIAITDGGTQKMFSLTGQQCKTIHHFNEQNILPENANLIDSKSQLTTLIIPFGRFIGDEQFALDLSKFSSAYIEITNDTSTTQCANGSLNVDIQLISFADMARGPTQYIKYYERFTEKPSADGQHVYHDIPPNDPLYMLFCQLDPDLETVGNAVNDPMSDSYNLKATLQNRAMTMWDHRPKDIVRTNAINYGLVNTEGHYQTSETQFADMAIAYVHSITDAYISNVDAGVPYWEDCQNRWQKLSASSGAVPISHIHARGVGYYHTLMLYHGLLINPNEWLNPATTGGRNPLGPVRIDMYGHKDDFTLRTCLAIAKTQGQT